MQRCVSRACDGHVYTNCILKGILGHDISGTNIVFNQADYCHARPLGQTKTLAIVAGDGAVAGQGHAKGLRQAVHGVGCEHAGAGTAARAAVLGQLFLLFLGHLTGVNLSNGFDAGGIVGNIVAVEACRHGTAGNDDSRDVHTGRRHDGAGHCLVTGDHQNQTVKAMGHGHGLNGVGDQLTAWERIHHSFMGHGDTVTNGDGGEFHGNAAVHQNTLLGCVGNAPQMEVAGNDLVEGIDHADQRLAANVLLQMTCGIQQASGIGVLYAGKDFFRIERHGILL